MAVGGSVCGYRFAHDVPVDTICRQLPVNHLEWWDGPPAG